MKSKKWKILITLLFLLCIICGIASGIYFEFVEDSTGNEENSTNWKKGFFRLTIVFSIIVSILGGTMFSRLAKKGKLGNEDEEDSPSINLTDSKSVFINFTRVIFGFIWLIYFIIQWPVYYIVIFVFKGFTG